MAISLVTLCNPDAAFSKQDLEIVEGVLLKEGVEPSSIVYRFHCRSDLAGAPWQLTAEFDDGLPYPDEDNPGPSSPLDGVKRQVGKMQYIESQKVRDELVEQNRSAAH